MSLENLYYLSQIVAVAAIVASLIFVGMQVRLSNQQTRQANRIARADLTRAAWERSQTIFHAPHKTTEGADFTRKAFDDGETLTVSEKIRLYSYLVEFVSSCEAMYWLRQDGFLGDEAYKRAFLILRVMFANKRVRRWWSRHRRDSYPDSAFADEVDGLSRDIEAAEGTSNPPGDAASAGAPA